MSSSRSTVTPVLPPLTSSGSTVAPTGRGYLRLVLVLGALVALGPLTIDTYLPALPALARDLGASEAATQFTLTGIMIGMGLGQLVLGPLSDAFGRRPVLLAGMAVHAVLSLLAALAPTIETLSALRVAQGAAGAAVTVTAMATVRDLYVGRRAAALLSHLSLVIGVAPILAPTLGGAVLGLTGWRGIFGMLSAIALVLLAVAFFGLTETLPVERRRPSRPSAVGRTYAGLLRDRSFMGLTLVAGLMFGALFSYVSGSSFVLLDHYGLDEQQFGLVFGLFSAGLIAATQVNPWLLRRFSPQQVLSGAVVAAVLTTVALLVAAVLDAPLVVLLVPLGLTVAATGFTFPNAPALALSRHGGTAGSAAAVLGALQFGIAGVITPLVGLLATGNAIGMASVMTGCVVAALLALLVLVRPWRLDD